MAIAQGSGFFISADGYVVTINHVVEHAKEVTVITADGKTVPARIVGTDPKTDLALFKVKEGSDYPYVSFASQEPRVGDWVIAAGNRFGLGGTVTAGIVSARARNLGAGPYDDFLQISAPNQGNSGSPTFNTEGEVVGVNTAIFSPSGGSVGISFAVASDVAKGVVQQLKDNGKVARGWLGVQIQPGSGGDALPLILPPILQQRDPPPRRAGSTGRQSPSRPTTVCWDAGSLQPSARPSGGPATVGWPAALSTPRAR
jgi:serine protease Do